MFRLLLWLFRLLVLLLVNLLLTLIAAVLRFILMPVVRVIVWLFGSLISFSVTATVTGPRQYIDRLAGEWTMRIHEGARDRSHINEIFQLCRFLIGTIIVLGWVVSGYFTYQLLRIVFGFFI